jgi:hypothetical protein
MRHPITPDRAWRAWRHAHSFNAAEKCLPSREAWGTGDDQLKICPTGNPCDACSQRIEADAGVHQHRSDKVELTFTPDAYGGGGERIVHRLHSEPCMSNPELTSPL